VPSSNLLEVRESVFGEPPSTFLEDWEKGSLGQTSNILEDTEAYLLGQVQISGGK
jgi:hypothetical protein